MSSVVMSWRCKCGVRLKLIGEKDQDQPHGISVAKCPQCQDTHVIHCRRINSIIIEQEESAHGDKARIDAHTESCSVKTRLLTEWNNAAKAYSKMVAELANQIGEVSEGDYERLKQLTERARQLSKDAKTRLDGQMFEHGCGGEA